MDRPRITNDMNSTPKKPIDLRKGGFYLLTPNTKILIDTPAKINDYICIDKADRSQILLCKQAFDKYIPPYMKDYAIMLHEKKFDVEDELNSKSISFSGQENNYSILTYDCKINKFTECIILLPLLDRRLKTGYSFVTSEPFGTGEVISCGFNTRELDIIYNDIFDEIIIDYKFIDDIITYSSLYDCLDKSLHNYIISAINSFYFLTSNIYNPDYFITGCFSIIEMLLTHNPNQKEIGDSITHQLKTKISLIESRTKDKIKYNIFGININNNSIWNSLYKYRSCVSHGEIINLSKDMAILKNVKLIVDFMSSTTQILIKHALTEPDLITYLKKV